ncbi:hypothetical protein B8W93_11245 [Lentilactobacillus kefiri]|jgi:hypothetical protein|uniref:hypothetical protein n=1 Tax=Lactobacillales TaxID=186826 RepID=UPI000B9B76AC|nr:MULTISPECIES: hypothetical protein [Lactobacillales]OXT10161.1 hypothetical protein CBI42_10990 [Streptococcus sp. KR]PAK80684.1 hypothetical protein B8W85_11410 [Lentilactobacillus kefiri]PAL05196.1 hypothetical protein B8W93_11245 [Lentilactobacillus kefiri]
MSKKIWIVIFRYLLAIGLFLAYSAIFDNQDHDLIRSTLVFAICLGLAIIPFSHKTKSKK